MKIKPFHYLSVTVLALVAIGYVSAQAQSDSNAGTDRTYRSDRQSHSGRRGYRQTRSSAAMPVPGPQDYTAFSEFIAERNIFNPDRFPHRPGVVVVSTPVSHSAPGFSFVGAMAYGKGTFAFFDGNDDEYRKSLQVSGTIAGYTVQEITMNHVILADGTNTITLPVGAVMRKARDGSWAETDDNADFSAETAGAGSSSGSNSNGSASSTDAAPATPAAPTGQMSDILKKLMKQRELENK